MTLTQTKSKLGDIFQRLKGLEKQQCFIGVPADEDRRSDDKGQTARKEEGINNALLAYIQENGSPAQHIPARHFLIPGVAEVQAQAVEILKKSAADVLDNGDHGQNEIALNKVGLMGQNAVRKYITDHIGMAPLAPKTIRARAYKHKTRKGAAEAVRLLNNDVSVEDITESGLANPLIDTGALRRSISYVVKESGK